MPAATRISWNRWISVAIASGTLVIGSATAAVAAPAKAKSSGPVVVVSGLNNPRQLDLVHGVLLIAEAGKGGTLATISDPEGGTQGIGLTGSISAVLSPSTAHGQQPHRIVKGLLSAASAADSDEGPKGSGATGSDGVAARNLKHIAIQETFFGDAAPKADQWQNGALLLARPFGSIKPIADISGFEAKHDPDQQGVDSDPYAVITYGSGWLVADAAGNDILRVDKWGHITRFHVFANVTSGDCAGQQDPPPFPGCDFVPTSMATDSHGNVYVGGLSSLTPGEAKLVKLNRHGHLVHGWGGFTSITGVAVGHDGAIYVSQLFADEAHPALPILQGVLTKISHNHRTNMDVPFPAGIAVDRHNNVFVSAFSILPDTGAGVPGVDTSGQVWKVRF